MVESLSHSAQVLARTCCLVPSLFELTAYISQFLRSGHDSLLSNRNLVLKRCQTLLRARQLVLEIRQALSLRFNGAIDLTGSLLGCLQCLLRSCQFCFGLLTGVGDLPELLLGGLVALLQVCQLSLNLVARLCGLRDLLLSPGDLRLQVSLLPIDLGLQLTLLSFEAGLFRRKPFPSRGQ